METLDLKTALDRSAARLAAELPVAHITTARWLGSILDEGRIQPRLCTVFNRELLYFSYGGVFYRSLKSQTQNATELPIAMVFSPKVLDVAFQLFPFDSGAMAAKLFGEDWWDKMH